MLAPRSLRTLALGLALGATLGGATLGAAAARRAAPHPILLTGHDWDRLSGDARDAYLQGFIAGAAAHQAAAAKGSAEGRAVARRAAALRERDALKYPYRENVYRSHLDDYFFYRDRRTQTLIEVLTDINGPRHGHAR
jgi:hypothetical protein